MSTKRSKGKLGATSAASSLFDRDFRSRYDGSTKMVAAIVEHIDGDSDERCAELDLTGRPVNDNPVFQQFPLMRNELKPVDAGSYRSTLDPSLLELTPMKRSEEIKACLRENKRSLLLENTLYHITERNFSLEEVSAMHAEYVRVWHESGMPNSLSLAEDLEIIESIKTDPAVLAAIEKKGKA